MQTKEPAMVAFTCNPRPGKQKERAPQNSLGIQSSLLGEFQSTEKARLKQNKMDHLQKNGTASRLNTEETKPERDNRRSTVSIQTPGNRAAAGKPDRCRQSVGMSGQSHQNANVSK